MKHLLVWFILLALCLQLAGCTAAPGLTSVALLSTEQLSTSIAQTVQARLSASPVPAETDPASSSLTPASELLTPSPGSATPSLTPTQKLPTQTPGNSPTSTATLQPSRTPSPTPTQDLDNAPIQIQQPGPMSKVVSPLTVGAYVRPGTNGRVQIELIGEDGRLMVRKVEVYDPAVKWVFISDQLEFDVSGVSEMGRLQIKTQDKFGREMEQVSVDLILLSMGEADLNPPGPLTIAAIIQEPSANKMIQGGTLVVSGLSRIPVDQPLLVQLIASNGEVKGYRQVEPPQETLGGYGPFTVSVPYKVTTPTWVRLTFQASSSGRVPGVVYTTSLEVLLSP